MCPVVAIASLAGCAPDKSEKPWFVDRTAESALSFRHDSGARGERRFPEINGGGVSLFDADGDGSLDVFLPQGAPVPATGSAPSDRLFLQRRPLEFEDAGPEHGLDDGRCTYSGIPADVDADGDIDVLLCSVTGSTLFENRGEARFRRTDWLQPAPDRWASTAAFADFDRDGDLDLYLVHYVRYDVAEEPLCEEKAGETTLRAYCHPDLFEGEADRYFRNGSERHPGVLFEDASAEAGIDRVAGKGLGICVFDLEEDGDLDVFVAHDHQANALWRNEGNATFQDEAGRWGVAYGFDGRAQSSMGVDLADADGDGDADLIVTNMAAETDALYRQQKAHFIDDAALSGLAGPSLPLVGFGARFGDFDLDGDPDLLVAHGHVLDNVHRFDPTQAFAQPLHLYENLGGARFLRIPAAEAGERALRATVGRGLAVGDLDEDGDLDAIVAAWGSEARVLENRSRDADGGPGWIAFSVEDAHGRPDVGARVRIDDSDGFRVAWVRVSASYGGAQDARVRFGVRAGKLRGAVRFSNGIGAPFGPLERNTVWRLVQDGDGVSVARAGDGFRSR